MKRIISILLVISLIVCAVSSQVSTAQSASAPIVGDGVYYIRHASTNQYLTLSYTKNGDEQWVLEEGEGHLLYDQSKSQRYVIKYNTQTGTYSITPELLISSSSQTAFMMDDISASTSWIISAGCDAGHYRLTPADSPNNCLSTKTELLSSSCLSEFPMEESDDIDSSVSVEQYDFSNEAQEWVLEAAATSSGTDYLNGYFIIRNKGTNTYLSADNSSSSMQDVTLYPYESEYQQVWMLKYCNNGQYRLTNPEYPYLSLSVNSVGGYMLDNVPHSSDDEYKDFSQHTLQATTDGYYLLLDGTNRITAKSSTSHVITISSNNSDTYTDLEQWEFISVVPDGKYRIRNASTKTYLYVDETSSTLQAKVAEFESEDAFIWNLERNTSNGDYYFSPQSNPETCLQAAALLSGFGVNCKSKSSTYTTQRWRLETDNNKGLFSIDLYNAGIRLAVSSTGSVICSTASTDTTQQWYLEPVIEDGAPFIMRNLYYGTYLSIDDNTDVVMDSYRGKSSQQWKLQSAGDGSYYLGLNDGSYRITTSSSNTQYTSTTATTGFFLKFRVVYNGKGSFMFIASSGSYGSSLQPRDTGLLYRVAINNSTKQYWDIYFEDYDNVSYYYDSFMSLKYSNAVTRIITMHRKLQEFYSSRFLINLNRLTATSVTTLANNCSTTNMDQWCSCSADSTCNNSHHTNYARIFSSFATHNSDKEQTMGVLYTGRRTCDNSSGLGHEESPRGVSNIYTGCTAIFDNQSAPTIPSGQSSSQYMDKIDAAVLIHEIGHLYNLPDHPTKNGCIMSASVYDLDTLDDMVLCDRCYQTMMTHRDLYNHN